MNAPQVTPADVEATIASEHYFTAGEGVAGALVLWDEEYDGPKPTAQSFIGDENFKALDLLTFCVLITRGGHTVTGESHCQDLAKFNAETGRIEARKAAIEKLWPMVVYAERERLAAPSVSATAAIARKFIDDHHVSCVEATINDRVYEHAPELVEQLADVVGYYKHPEEQA